MFAFLSTTAALKAGQGQGISPEQHLCTHSSTDKHPQLHAVAKHPFSILQYMGKKANKQPSTGEKQREQLSLGSAEPSSPQLPSSPVCPGMNGHRLAGTACIAQVPGRSWDAADGQSELPLPPARSQPQRSAAALRLPGLAACGLAPGPALLPAATPRQGWVGCTLKRRAHWSLRKAKGKDDGYWPGRSPAAWFSAGFRHRLHSSGSGRVPAGRGSRSVRASRAKVAGNPLLANHGDHSFCLISSPRIAPGEHRSDSKTKTLLKAQCCSHCREKQTSDLLHRSCPGGNFLLAPVHSQPAAPEPQHPQQQLSTHLTTY